MKNIFLSLSVLLVMACSCVKQQEGVNLVDSNKFEEQMKESTSQIIDVRTTEEFSDGHIVNAVNMDVTSDDFEAKIASLDKEKPVMVYCKSGGRSAKAAAILRDNGFKQVYDLDGGMIGWNAASKPIEN
ncbi:rhodanese-like domain-containing protein [Flavobacterium gelidilacus]|jgi:rhodanese-related sulfurtransferase|uniref:rhodanese-like domain-containing protein n=1 Tax=Flavobacterium gelidilacus TaxID=206041 RepID=UPI000412B8D2|nr:rhodanese-like domain-containing protein [Flavobacterium gelidilacus]